MEVIKITLYHANWCHYCIEFIPTWNNLKTYVKSGANFVNSANKQIKIVTDEYEVTKDREKFSRAGINSFPTIKIEKGNGQSYEYNGERTVSAIINDVTQKYSLKRSLKGGYDSNYAKYKKYKLKYLKLKANRLFPQ